ncbi:MAG: PQQ-binding-like beta-propeller repeat protein [Gammaproteobacteria bacterium]
MSLSYRNLYTWFTLTALFLILSGCSSKTLLIPDPLEPPFVFGPEVQLLWSTQVGKGAADASLRLQQDTQNPEYLYLANTDSVLALKTATGKIVWEAVIGEVSSGVTQINDALIAATFDGDIYALSKEDGQVQWTTALSGEVLAPATATGTRISLQTNNGQIVNLNQETGAVEWLLQNPKPALSLRGNSSPLSVRSQVFTVDDNCKARMLDVRSGSVIWEHSLAIPSGSNEIDRLVDGDSQPIALAENLYVACYNNHVIRLHISDGTPLWQHSTNTRIDLLLAGTNLIAVEDHSAHLVAIDAVNGRTNWKNKKLQYRRLTNPVQWKEYILLGDEEGFIHMLDDSGRIVGRFRPTKKPIRTLYLGSDSTATSSYLYILDHSGTLWVYADAS